MYQSTYIHKHIANTVTYTFTSTFENICYEHHYEQCADGTSAPRAEVLRRARVIVTVFVKMFVVVFVTVLVSVFVQVFVNVFVTEFVKAFVIY